MSRGRRYDEPKLNIKKVIAVIVAIIVLIMFIIAIKKLLDTSKKEINTSVVSYYPIYTNEKWGVIDSNGKIIIEPTYQDTIIIPNNKEDIFLCTYEIDYNNNTYKTKVLDAKNKEKFQKYESVQALENYDEQHAIWYEQGVLKVKQNGKYGLINYKGKETLPTEYDEIESLKGIQNSLIIKKNNLVGLCNNEGSIIIKPEYKEIKAINEDYKAGYIVVNQENQYGVIDFDKKVILEAKYQEIQPIKANGMYVVKENGVKKLIDKTGNTLIENKFDTIKQINIADEVIYTKDSQYGIMKTDGTQIVAPQYQDLTYTNSNYYIAKKAGKYGIIDNNNEVKVPFEYAQIIYRKEADFFELEVGNGTETKVRNNKLEEVLTGIVNEVNISKGYVRVRIQGEYKYYNFKFEEKTAQELLPTNTLYLNRKDGRYGYVDKNNQIVVEHQYDDAKELNEYGFAAVKKDGKWGAIDKEGKEVVEPKYDLEENLVIDFIGKWHLGTDLNLNYYTDK